MVHRPITHSDMVNNGVATLAAAGNGAIQSIGNILNLKA